MVVLPPPVGPTNAATCPGSMVKLTSSRICSSVAVAERHAFEGDRALERGRGAGVPPVAHAAFGLQDLADPLEADARLRHRVAHLRQVAHRLVHLPEVEQEDDQRPGGQLAGQDQPRAVPQHQAGAGGHDDLDGRREQHLEVAGPQRGLDVLEALALEPLLLVVFAREGLDHANRGEDLRHHRHQLAFLLPDVARGALDAPREGIHHQEQHRRDRQ